MLTPAALAAADVASGVLAVAGVAKLREPASFAAFLATLGRRPDPRHATTIARLVGSLEVAVALAAVVVGGTLWFAALGLLFLALAGISAVALARRAPSCGCFGAASAPTSPSHVVLDLVFAAGAIAAAAADSAPLVDRLTPAATGATYLLLVGLATALAVTAMTTAADLSSLRRSLAPATPSTQARR